MGIVSSYDVKKLSFGGRGVSLRGRSCLKTRHLRLLFNSREKTFVLPLILTLINKKACNQLIYRPKW